MTLHVDTEQKPQCCKCRCHQHHGSQTENDHFSSLCDCIVNTLAGTLARKACAKLTLSAGNRPAYGKPNKFLY